MRQKSERHRDAADRTVKDIRRAFWQGKRSHAEFKPNLRAVTPRSSMGTLLKATYRPATYGA